MRLTEEQQNRFLDLLEDVNSQHGIFTDVRRYSGRGMYGRECVAISGEYINPFVVALLLPIAGVAYEMQRLAAKHPTNPVVRAFIAPGMLMQRLTTKAPDDAQLEVALAALRKAVWREQQSLPPANRTATVETFPSFAAVDTQLPLAA